MIEVISFYSSRYNTETKHAIATVLDMFANNRSFNATVFMPPESYTVKLNDLVNKTIAAGFYNSLSSAQKTRLADLSTSKEI